MTEEHLYLTQPDGLQLSCIYTQPQEAARACVLLIHGAKEHQARYLDLRHALTKAGFATVSCDLRGHGKSTSVNCPLGALSSQDILVQELQQVAKMGLDKSKASELYLFGHSMGSLLARRYLLKAELKPSRVVLSGTVQPLNYAQKALRLAGLICRIGKDQGHSLVLKQVVDSPKNEWVNSCPTALEAYRNDPFCCGYRYYNKSVFHLIEMTASLKANIQNPDLDYQPEILSISGKEDIRITGGKAGIIKSLRLLRDQGFRELSYKIYPELKHELVIGSHNNSVLADLVNFYQGNDTSINGLERLA